MRMRQLEPEYNGTIVLDDLGVFGKKSERYAIFKCKHCGNSFKTKVSSVKSGATESCGCYGRQMRKKAILKHGDSSRTSEHFYIYNTWANILARCYKPYATSYCRYGGKGVTVCDEWKDDYLTFKKWALDNGYKKGLTIDKDIKSKELGINPPIYSPDTCLVVSHIKNTQSDNQERCNLPQTKYKNVIEDKRKKHKKYFGQKSVYNKIYRTKYFYTAKEADKALRKLLEECNG